MNRLQFVSIISSVLADHPDWLHDALRAVAAGQEEALRRARERAANSDAGMLAALVLAKDGRVNQETREALAGVVVKAIHQKGCAPIEKEFLEKWENIRGRPAYRKPHPDCRVCDGAGFYYGGERGERVENCDCADAYAEADKSSD